MLKFK